jgi:hypothetical protein
MGSLVTFKAPITADIAVNGTFTVSYPSGYAQTSLANSGDGYLSINDNEVFRQGLGVQFTFGASNITVQNTSPIPWPAGTIVNIGLSRTDPRGSNNVVFGTRPSNAAQGGGVVGPYPAPTGFRWGYVTENTITVTENGEPVVELERIAA